MIGDDKMDVKILSVFTATIMIILTVICVVVFGSNSKDAKNKVEENKTDDKITTNDEEQLEKSDPVPEQKNKNVSFVAVGDNIIHSSVYTDAENLAKGTEKEYDFVPMYENVADIISGADLAYINQESPFAGKESVYSGYPMFNSPEQVGYDLIEVGFDIVNLANNHMLDRYTSGYQKTIDFWKKQKGITYIGGYENEDDYNDIRVVEKNGISIALLAYTYGTNGVKLDSGSDMIIPLCDESGTAEIDRQTKLAREKADIVIVSIHWGYEDAFEPSELQEKQMQVMVNNGVDVILGSHPHVLQPMLWKDRPDGGKTLVVYSLGNFLSGMLYVRNNVGGIVGFDIEKDNDGAFIKNPYFIPTVCHYNYEVRGFKIYKLSEYSRELYYTHGAYLSSDAGRKFEYLREIVDKTIPKEFLIEDFYN